MFEHPLAILLLLSVIGNLAAIGLLMKPQEPKRPANGGTRPADTPNLDAPTYTRKQTLEQLREHGFEIVHPAPFRELQPMQPEESDAEAEITHILNPDR